MSEIKEIKTGSTTGAFFFLAILVIIAGIFLFKASFFYQLESYEKAVVFTLGKVGEDPVGEGFHGRLPWPIQEVEIVNTEKDRRIQIGFRSDINGGRIHKPKQASMLTRDANIVDLEVEVNYTISDVVNYIIKVSCVYFIFFFNIFPIVSIIFVKLFSTVMWFYGMYCFKYST